MKPTLLPFVLAATSTLAAPRHASEASPALRRFALVAGANRGAADQPALRYAVSDAERFARLITTMGGVAPADAVLLREPAQSTFMDALASLRVRAAEARRGAARVEVLVYFSGHADEQGLLLGAERLPYRDLRAAISSMPVDVGIAVLDACASGAITRLKGGQSHPAFLTDVSMAVTGYAFLASSSESEAAQESDRVGGSYFTHALLTGLRGAADVSGDGRVTLGEAYQFAFGETLAQTTPTQGGAQHPSYDIKMAGTGDVVMTDVRKVSASLILGPDYDGRFYVLDAAGVLVAEMHKAEGRTIELGLEPGEYRIYFEQSKKLMSASMQLSEGQRQELVRGGLQPAPRLPTLSRGGSQPPDRLDQSMRIGLQFGIPGTGTTGRDGYAEYGDAQQLTLHRWLRPTLALEVGAIWRGVSDYSQDGSHDGTTRGVTLGGRYYVPRQGWFRPYFGLGAGGFDSPGEEGLQIGFLSGLGADMYIGDRVSLSIEATINQVEGQPFLVETRVGIGWTWGGKRRGGDPAESATN